MTVLASAVRIQVVLR